MTAEHFVLQASLIVFGLFAAMLLFQELGRRLGTRHMRLDPDHGKTSAGAAEGAVLGMLGLFLAFTFSGAGARFDARRHLIVDEANAIGTAYLRLDVLPEADRPPLRQLMRDYLDARLETYRAIPDMKAVWAANSRAVALQHRIWDGAIASAGASDKVAPYTVLLPALNDMIDITTTRTASMQMHPPFAVYLMLFVLALIASMFAGYGLATRKRRTVFHSVGFATIMALAIFVILNMEFPRVGLIRENAIDQVLVDLRTSMKG